MTIEQSHGRARPTLPRSGDLPKLPAPPTVGEPRRQRDANGRFAPGNGQAIGRGFKASLAKLLGRDLVGEAEPLAREAAVVYRALLAEMPHQGAQVSSLVAARARFTVLSARYAARAAELGLDTEEGVAALELSMKLDQRAERLAVTACDIAARLAQADRKRKPADTHAAVLERFGTRTVEASK